MLHNIPEGESHDEIMTYADYINKLHPKAEDGSYSEEVKEIRMKLLTSFPKPGGPGAKFKNACEKLMKTLTLPKGAKEELGITEDGAGLNVDETIEDEEKKEHGDGEESEELDPKQKAE